MCIRLSFGLPTNLLRFQRDCARTFYWVLFQFQRILGKSLNCQVWHRERKFFTSGTPCCLASPLSFVWNGLELLKIFVMNLKCFHSVQYLKLERYITFHSTKCIHKKLTFYKSIFYLYLYNWSLSFCLSIPSRHRQVDTEVFENFDRWGPWKV